MAREEHETRAQHVRDAIRTLATARAKNTRFQHGAENTAGVIKAKAKEAAARVETSAAEMKRGAEKRVDDARVNVAKGKGK